MKNTFLFLLTLLWIPALYGQHKDFSIEWENQKNISSKEKEVLHVPGFSDAHFEFLPGEEKILFTAQWRETGSIASSNLTQINYEVIPERYLRNLNLKNIPEQVEFELRSVRGRDENFLVLQLSPIIKEGNIFKKITSFRVNYELSHRRVFDEVNNTPSESSSVLASGNFYKFQVEKTGVYKISASFLNSLGMDVSSIDPRKIKIYGHGGEMLPLKNSENFYYDPPEIPIRVIGESDGSFDNNDYILFYGIGTKGNWNEESETNLNLYDDASYYFITADGENGKRITSYQEPSGNPDITINTFDDRDFYEVDEVNIGKVGRTWFGDQFDVRNERTYKFNFPNIVQGSQVKLEIHAAAASETNTSLRAEVNGSVVGSMNFSSLSTDIFARHDYLNVNVPANSDEIEVKLRYYNNGNPASIGYLDYINVSAERNLIAGKNQFIFSKKNTGTQSGIGLWQLQNTADISEVWEITDPYQISRIPNQNADNQLGFKSSLGEVKRFIAVSEHDYYTPIKPRQPRQENVNLKGTVFRDAGGEFKDVDYIIISPENFLNQASRIAEIRRNLDGLNTKIVLDQDVYAEFSSGKQDIVAIRNFIKYVYDNASAPDKRLKYILLLGNASIDYKDRLPDNNNIIPTFENKYSYSLRHDSSASDDFFGMMDPEEGLMHASEKLDIAVGRIPADNPQMAKSMVDKIINYASQQSYGPWRNNFILISDDADDASSGGAGLQFALDALGDEISENKPFINVKKIHSDAYEQVYTSGGQRYPEVNKAITDNIEVGASVVNYFGHGGEEGLASEFIVTREDIKGWRNKDRYNVFVTVTCEFTRFDNPLRVSPGELSLINEQGGSVALVSTTRTIPVTTGTLFNNQIAPYLFNYEEQGYSVAEAVRRAKNSISAGSRRVVFFFGDPAMQLAFPDPEINLTAINDKPLTQPQDTLKALSKVKISGEVVSPDGNLLSNYNGTLTATIFDKPIERQTLGNDGATDNNGNLIIMDFKTLGNVMFRGKASVKNGKFEFNFVVPKDIRMPVGKGRISFYSQQHGALQDNKGYNNEILVGDINKDAPEDNEGPEIQLFMNDESFVSGGMTDASPIIVAKLSDENGINTTSGIGHDIIAYIDGDETNPIVLNDYYQAEEDDYTQGKVSYKLHDLEKGPHTLTFRAWDVYNNSSTAELQFVVAEKDELKIEKVLNYPNPFHDYTEFWFNHNRPFEPLEVQVQVFTVSGRLVWSRSEVINTEGFLSRDITWNGRDDFGSAIGKGVYVYKLTVKSVLANQKVEKYEKLVIL